MRKFQATFILISLVLAHFGIAASHVLSLHQSMMQSIAPLYHCWHWGPVKMC